MTKEEAQAGLDRLLGDVDVPFHEALAFIRRFRAELTPVERAAVYTHEVALRMSRRYVRADVRHLRLEYDMPARLNVERARAQMR